MGQVAISLNGKSYRFVCGEGEEARIAALGHYIASKLESLGHHAGRPGDDRTLVMAALMIADELFDARERADGASAVVAAGVRAKKPSAG